MRKKVLTAWIPLIVIVLCFTLVQFSTSCILAFGYDVAYNNIHYVFFETIKAIDDCEDLFLDDIRFSKTRVKLVIVEEGCRI